VDLIAIAGSPLANSYVTLQHATDLLTGRLHTEPWTAGDDWMEDSARALIWATRLLNEHILWDGRPTTLTQALPWPMAGQQDALGRPLDPTTIPPDIALATALYALALRRDTSENVGMQEQGALASVKAGDTTIVFRTAGLPATPWRRMPAEVRFLLRCYGTMSGGVNIPLLRV
jgi:hypothetical protein